MLFIASGSSIRYNMTEKGLPCHAMPIIMRTRKQGRAEGASTFWIEKSRERGHFLGSKKNCFRKCKFDVGEPRN